MKEKDRRVTKLDESGVRVLDSRYGQNISWDFWLQKEAFRRKLQGDNCIIKTNKFGKIALYLVNQPSEKEQKEG